MGLFLASRERNEGEYNGCQIHTSRHFIFNGVDPPPPGCVCVGGGGGGDGGRCRWGGGDYWGGG